MIIKSSPQMEQTIYILFLSLGRYGFIKVGVSQPLIIPDSGDEGMGFLPEKLPAADLPFPLQTLLLCAFSCRFRNSL